MVPNWISEQLRGRQSVIESSRRLAQRGQFGIDDLVQIALDDSAEIDFRVDAITLLTASTRSNESALRRLLESRSKIIATETLKRVREFGPEWAVSEILSKVRASNDPSERAVLAWALGGYPGRCDALEALMGLLQSDSDDAVRSHAIESLSVFRSPVVVDALLRVLEHGSVSERFWSIYSLGMIRDPGAVEAVSKCLQDETEVPHFGTISAEAKWALEEIKRPLRDGRQGG